MYTLSAFGPSIVRDADGASIPIDPANRDHQAYLAWVADGNTPSAALVPTPPVPTCQIWQLQATVTPTQWAAVQAYIAASGDAALQAFAVHGTNPIPANSTTLAALATAAGIDPATLPALVAQAAALVIP